MALDDNCGVRVALPCTWTGVTHALGMSQLISRLSASCLWPLLVPKCPGYFCKVWIFCTRQCQLVAQSCSSGAAGGSCWILAQVGWKLEDEAALKLLEAAVCDCHVVQ